MYSAMVFLLNVVGGLKSQGFNLKYIEVLVNRENQSSLFKRAQVVKFLGLSHIGTSTTKLIGEDTTKILGFLLAEGSRTAIKRLKST